MYDFPTVPSQICQVPKGLQRRPTKTFFEKIYRTRITYINNIEQMIYLYDFIYKRVNGSTCEKMMIHPIMYRTYEHISTKS